jgi:hypothetical protein
MSMISALKLTVGTTIPLTVWHCNIANNDLQVFSFVYSRNAIREVLDQPK